MAESVDFFSDKKKVTYTLVGLCAAALFFVLVCPMASVYGVGISGGSLASLYKLGDKFPLFIYCLYFFPVIAGAITWFKTDKKTRWIAGGVLLLAFVLFLIQSESGIGMGSGVILYLLLTIAYFVVNFLAKE